MAVVVSGASGFLGSRFVERLSAAGKDVIAVTRSPILRVPTSSARVRWVSCDIAKENIEVSGQTEIEAVVHLAAVKDTAGEDEQLFLRNNELAMVRLLKVLGHRTGKFVFASSQMVYGDAQSRCITEEFPLQPDCSAYACSKINCENWLRWFQRRHGGLYLALRFCGFLDSGGIVEYLLNRALLGEPIELHSNGRRCRDYLPSAEAVNALVAALEFAGEPGFVPVNIGSGQTITAHQLATAVCEELQSTSRIDLLSRPSPLGDLVLCIERARKLLGFQPDNLEESVRHHARRRKEQRRCRVENAQD